MQLLVGGAIFSQSDDMVFSGVVNFSDCHANIRGAELQNVAPLHNRFSLSCMLGGAIYAKEGSLTSVGETEFHSCHSKIEGPGLNCSCQHSSSHIKRGSGAVVMIVVVISLGGRVPLGLGG